MPLNHIEKFESVREKPELDELRGLVRPVSQTLFWFALTNAQPQKIKRTTFQFRINKHSSINFIIIQKRITSVSWQLHLMLTTFDD